MTSPNWIQPVDQITPLKQSYAAFRRCILSIPEELFLSPINGWSPRDVVAHLIGWNDLMITASESIRNGETPAYYGDSPNNYNNINAAFVAKHSSTDKAVLLSELAQSFARFTHYLQALEPGEVEADYNVIHYSGEPATIARIIQSLAGDYDHHRRELERWLEGGNDGI